MLEWAESKFRIDTRRENRIILGHSNGGRFAATMGVKHPETFGHVIAFSIGAGSPPTFEKEPDFRATYYLAAGTWEVHFHKLVKEFHEGLKTSEFDTTFSSRVAGHDQTMWQEEFSRAIQKVLPVNK